MELIDAAVAYAEGGFSVIPVHYIREGACSCGKADCERPAKHPRMVWFNRSKTAMTSEEVRQYWERNPDSNIGIVTGRVSGIAVLDIDGDVGRRSLERAGLPVDSLPSTPTSDTGGGGEHRVYRYPDGRAVKTSAGILSKVDVRGDGGFVVVPPSVHASGNSYRWRRGLSLIEQPPADFDFGQLLVDRTEPEVEKNEKNWHRDVFEGVAEGERNSAAAKLVGRYFRLGMTEPEIVSIMGQWRLRCTPPLDMSEIWKIINSINRSDSNQIAAEEPDVVLPTISGILSLEVEQVDRLSGSNPKYVFYFAGAGQCVLTTSQLLSPKSFQQAIAETTKHVMRKLSSKSVPTHERFVQMVMRAAEDIDSGEESTDAGEMWTYVEDFLSSRSTIPAEPALSGPFVYKGRVWIPLKELIHSISARWNRNLTLAETAHRLKLLKFVHEAHPTLSKEKTVWGVDHKRLERFISQVASHQSTEYSDHPVVERPHS